MSEKTYIHIRNWDRYQHADTTRNKTGALPWIKDYTGQLNDSEFLELGFADRGLLDSLRLQYALNQGRGVVDSTTNLSRLLGQRVYRSQLERLNHAGFILFSASKLLATCKQPASTDVEERRENPLPPLGENSKTTPKPRRPKHPDQMTYEEKNPYQCGIGKCTIRHATQWKIEEHREVIHRIPPAQNGHVEPEVALARADLFGDTEPDLEEEA